MKCKIHPYEPGVGVCASCLRGRLSALAAAQSRVSGDPPRRSPPPQFPRSVSPYVARRRSDASPAGANRRTSFSTPQVAGGFGRRTAGRFSALRVLFGRRRGDLDLGFGGGGRGGSSSWFSSLGWRRGKKSSPAGEEGYSSEDSGEFGRRRAMPTPMWWFAAGRSGRRRQRSGAGDERSVVASSASSTTTTTYDWAGLGGIGGPSVEPNRWRKLGRFGRGKGQF